LTSFMRKLEFTTLLRRVAEGLGAPLPEGMTPSTTPQRKKKDDYDHPLRRSPRGEFVTARPAGEPAKGGVSSPAQLAVMRAAKLEAIPFDRSNYETVTDSRRLAELLAETRYLGRFAFRVKLNSSDPMRSELVGVALALRPGHAAYVPLAHRASDGLDLSGDTVAQIPMREALDLLKPILEDASVLKIVQNAKFDMVALARYGIALDTIDDPCLMSYALDAGRAEHLPEQLAGALLSLPASPTRRSWALAAPPSPSIA
jgi:DNA polymerase-1